MTEQIEGEYAEDLKLLGKRIKKFRTERGLSVRDMVVQHDYHDAQWRRFEKGASLTVPSLLRIAKALGVSLSILLDGIGDFPAPPGENLKGKLLSSKSSKVKKTK